jgi:small subunit ribosomal protein S17
MSAAEEAQRRKATRRKGRRAPKAEAAKAPKSAAKSEAKAAPPAPPSVPEAAPSRPVPAAPASQAQQAAALAKRTFRRKLVGRVTSDKMNKTVVVEVVRRTLDPVYKKYVKSRARYKAHDEKNQYKVGDRVEITGAPPDLAREALDRHAIELRSSSKRPEWRNGAPMIQVSTTSRSPTTPALASSSASRCSAARAVGTPASATSSSSPSRRRCPAPR